MKKILSIIVLCLLLTSANALGSSFTTVGDITCDQVISGHEKNNKAGRYQVIDWMNGYVTGRNIETKLNRNKGKDLGVESLIMQLLIIVKKSIAFNYKCSRIYL